MGMIGEIFALAGLHVDTASFAQYGSALQAAEGNVSNFASGTQALLAGAFALPAVALAGIAGYGVSLASGFQDAGTTLTTLYGTADLAKEKFQWMTEFAATTPFQFDEIVQGGIKLKAYGKDIDQYGRTFGDTASGMGKSFNDVIEAVADAQTGEFERLKELGIKAVQVTKANLDQYAQYGGQVGDTMLTYVNRSGQQMAQAVDRNNREMITSTLEAIWNEKYAGAMATRSQTLSGMMSTLKDNLTFGLADIVGYDMKNMEVQTLSLMGVLMGLAGVAVTVTGSFSNMSEPMQTFLVVAAVGGAAALLLSGGLIAASAAGITTTAVMSALAVAVNLVIWPATLIVGGLALLAAGLVYLDEKTGLVTATWEVLKDVFTIAYYEISAGFTDFKNSVIADIQEIQGWFSDILPPEVVSAITGAIALIQGKFSEWAAGTKAHAESLQKANADTSQSFDKLSNVNLGGTGAQIGTIDGLVKGLGIDTKAGTTTLEAMGKVPATGTIAGLTGIKAGVQGVQAPANQLHVELSAMGNVSFQGTNSQIVLVGSNGKNTSLTIAQLQEYLKQSGNVSQAGTAGQLALVDSAGKTTNITTQQAINLLKTAGVQSMSGTISGINGITSAWQQANAAANAYAKAAISQRQAEITYNEAMKGSTSTGQTSKEGVTVIPKTGYTASELATRKANNAVYNTNIGTQINNGSTLQKTAARRVV